MTKQSAKEQSVFVPELTPEQRRQVALSEMDLMDLMSESGDENLVYAGGEFQREVADSIQLGPEEALAFLGLPVRTGYLVKKGDYERITIKFNELFEIWKSNPVVTDGETLQLAGVDELFWANILFKVSKKSNIGKYVEVPIGGNQSTQVEKIKYSGPYITGNTIRLYIPDCPKSTEDRHYIVQLVCMTLTPKLQEDLQRLGYNYPKQKVEAV